MAQCPSLIGKSWVRILESLTIFGGTNLHFGASECFERPFCAYGWSKNVSLSCEYVQHAYPVSKYLSRCNLKGLATKSSSKSLFLLFFSVSGLSLLNNHRRFLYLSSNGWKTAQSVFLFRSRAFKTILLRRKEMIYRPQLRSRKANWSRSRCHATRIQSRHLLRPVF